MFGSQVQNISPTGGPNNDYIVPDVPQETISSLTVSMMNNEYFIVATSWSKDITIWKVDAQMKISKIANTQSTAPVLTSCVDISSYRVFFAGFDNKITCWEVSTNKLTPWGEHTAPIKTLKFIPENNLLISGGYDNCIKYWNSMQPNHCYSTLPVSSKVVSMDAVGNQLVAGLQDKTYVYVNLSQPTTIAKSGSTTHEYGTSSVAIYPKGGFVVSSVEGRCYIQYFGQLQAKSFPFRCHRVTVTNANPMVYPCNAAYFHPHSDIIVTVGGDGSYIFWNHILKTKIKTYARNSNPISCGAFSPDGQFFVYAASYNWMKGYNCEMRSNKHEIFIHKMTDSDLKK